MLEKIESMLDRAPEADDIQDLMDAEPFMKGYKQKIGLIVLSLLLAGLSLTVFYVVGKKMSPPELMLIKETGESVILKPAVLPNQSREAVKDWARETIQKSYTFDFIKIEDQLLLAQPYFTIDAWDVFKKSMLASTLVSQVRKNKFTVSVVAREDPVVDNAAGKAGNEFAWKLLVPITISFSGDAPTITQNLLVRMTIVRVPTTENPKGIGVLQMVSEPLNVRN